MLGLCLCVHTRGCELMFRAAGGSGPDASGWLGWKCRRAGGQMVSLMVAEIKEGIRGLQGVRSDGNYSK